MLPMVAEMKACDEREPGWQVKAEGMELPTRCPLAAVRKVSAENEEL